MNLYGKSRASRKSIIPLWTEERNRSEMILLQFSVRTNKGKIEQTLLEGEITESRQDSQFLQQHSFPFTHGHEKNLFLDRAQTSLLSTLLPNQFQSSLRRFLVSYSRLAKYFIPHPFPKIRITALQACNTLFPDSSTPHCYRCAKAGHRRVVRSC